VSVLVECRHCGTVFEVDVKAVDGPWWKHCPRCYPTNEPQEEPDDQPAA
jgi:hypothetical protein